MTDNEFIERFNKYIINHGLVLVELSNIEQYAEKYNITIDEHHRHSFMGGDKFSFFIKNRNSFAAFYPSIDTMIKGNYIFWSIFEFAERELIYNVGLFTDESLKKLLIIKGKSKEEIILKLQLMGY